MVINILSILLSVILIYSTFLSFKRGYLNLFETFCWSCVWLGVIYLSIRPDAIDIYLQNFLNISFKDTILTLSLLVLFVLNFRVYLKIKLNEKKLDKIIRSKKIIEFLKKK